MKTLKWCGKAVLAALTSLLIILRWPRIAAAVAGVVTGSLTESRIKDKYLRALISVALGIAFMFLLYNVAELAWLLVGLGCFDALSTWEMKFLEYKAT